jgi:hypothetical protein
MGRHINAGRGTTINEKVVSVWAPTVTFQELKAPAHLAGQRIERQSAGSFCWPHGYGGRMLTVMLRLRRTMAMRSGHPI